MNHRLNSWNSCFLVLAFMLPVAHSSVLDGLVSTPWGKVRGVPKKASTGIYFTSFEGIPYAKPPLGNLRFAKPVPSTGSNTSVLAADALKPRCLITNQTLAESEDCLYLDLYVPHSKSSDGTFSSPLTVMVYIHGGGFIYYTGDLNPERLMGKEVIVALVHYRLGAMGFLSTADDVLKGNYGLWDQRLAIQWVKDNVAAFGGDPNSITIFGESAGSASVSFQILAPPSKGLFKRAILQSGTATSSWALARRPSQRAHELGARLGCGWGNSNEVLADCLRKVDALVLQKAMFAQWLSTPTFQHIGDFMYVPVVDHEFVLDEPAKLIKNTTLLQQIGAFDIDIIVGVVNDEATLVLFSGEPSVPKAPNFGDFFAKDIVPYLIYQRYGVSAREVERVVDSFYSNNVPHALLESYQVSNAYADAQFVVPALEFVAALSQTKDTKLGHRYFYYFDYCPSFYPVVCMGHGTDVGFVFNYDRVNFTSADQHMSDVFVSLLTSFAKSGTPTATNVPQWRHFSTESNSYLRISTQSENKENLFPKRVQLWTETIPALLTMPVIPAPIIG